ncbi:MAG TPA: TerB family tellurite resistance protein [Burkholderiales bacterium]|nr:TerB family tellurite resistance protein [Burkholderiales bacterium]
MLKAFKRIFADDSESATPHGYELRHLELAVASLLHESTRVDLSERPEEFAAARRSLADLFGCGEAECAALLNEGARRARQLTSYYGPVSVIKRDYDLPQRILLIEHLWRIAYADGKLDLYEDHYVRKIAHLLYVPNTECMLARGRAAKER